jgi:transcriptional regulator with XRE-family HTH domain
MSPEELGQAIRNRRKLAKVTQADLADLSGLSVHTLSDLESGKGNPTLEVLSKLCSVMGLEIQLVPRKPASPSPDTPADGEAKS